MNNPFDFGAVLRNLRKQRGYTQKRLAKVLNVSETMISKYESNTAAPTFETVRTIASWFNVSIDSLAGNERPYTVSVSGLTNGQIEIVRELVKLYNEKNNSAVNTLTGKQYELLGRIVESFK
ncbi:MAG: helix-turn-helix transcriptional regulator [Oscillospiraceae bacterium]|nr:helix-turn-helix transcriptional regulator [Oscillospiraceae bacterium]